MKRVFFSLIVFLIILIGPNGYSAEAASKKVSLTISKGVSYYGEVINGKPHGKGSMKWGENKTYSGDWINGKRSGYGKYSNYQINDKEYGEKYSSLEIYEGNWSNDQKDGAGKFKKTIFEKQSDSFEMPELYFVSKGTFKKGEFIKGYTLEEEEESSSTVIYEDYKITIRIELTGTNPTFYQIWKPKLADYLADYQNFDGISYEYWTDGKGPEKTYKGIYVSRDYDTNSMIHQSGTFDFTSSLLKGSEITLDLFQNPDGSYKTVFRKIKNDQEVNSIFSNSPKDPILNKYKTELMQKITPYVSGFKNILSEETPFIDTDIT